MQRRAPVRGTTLLRSLPYTYMSQLVPLLDPQSPTFLDWRGLASRIPRSSQDDRPRYGTLDITNFELEYRRPGGSPTMSLISDWGTVNSTVQDLVGCLVDMGHYAAAEVLLPGVTTDPNLNGANRVSPRHAYSSLSDGTNVFALHNPHSEGREENLDSIHKDKSKAQQEFRAEMGPTGHREVSSSTDRRPEEVHYGSRLAEEDEEPVVSGCLPEFEPNKVKEFSYTLLSEMTDGFNEQPLSGGGNMVGEGGFGTVYLGRFSDGHECAIKKLKQSVFQCSDADVMKQYQNELRMLKSLKHENLVELYGYSFDGDSPCLVFHYLKNGSLQSALSKDSCLDLPWEVRVCVAQGTARGICYLHSMDVVHRDVKSANVLLSGDFTAKVADFGLMRAIPDAANKTHVLTSTIIGTSVYMSPEARFGEVSSKGDSFSYGVVLLELITGMEPFDKTRECSDIIGHVEDFVDDGCDDMILHLVDPRLKSSYRDAAVLQMYAIANECLKKKSKRPFLTEVLPQLMALDGTSCTDG